jgi:hypothetical protein
MPIWQPRVVHKMLRRGKKTAEEFYENKEKNVHVEMTCLLDF